MFRTISSVRQLSATVCRQNSTVARCWTSRASLLPANFGRHYSSGAGLEAKFKQCVDTSTKLRDDPGNEAKLKLYALFKQSTSGPCAAPKPSVFDMVGKYKWEAWSQLGAMSKDEAMTNYVALISKLIEEIGVTGGATSAPAAASSGNDSDHLVISNKEGALTLRLNRPLKKNSITMEMYLTLTSTLNAAAKDDKVRLALLTGTGDFYSSGNDLGQFVKGGDPKEMAAKAKVILTDFIEAFINFPKPLIGCINGHAIGIMVTTLGLCDLLIASEKATFTTPFSATAQSPEGCSSSTFPLIMGYSRANQMLMFNHRMTAKEAEACGFVAKVVPSADFEKYVEEWIHGEKGVLKTCAQNSMEATKSLVRGEAEKARLREVNRMECDKLVESWFSPNFPKFIAKFFSKKG